MEKNITIGDVKIPVRSTAAALIRYKANFERDAIKDLISLAGSMPKKSNGEDGEEPEEMKLGETFDIDVFMRFLWVFAKSADATIPPLEDWLDSFDILPFDFVAETLPQISDMLASTVKSDVKSKKK